MGAIRKLIINADDYGASEEVNAAVEELVSQGCLKSVSILANGRLWKHSVAFLRLHPEVSAGVHLNIIEGQPLSDGLRNSELVDEGGRMKDRNFVMKYWLMNPGWTTAAVKQEWRAQILRLKGAGLELTHIDSHQHVHAFPPAFRIAVGLCHEFGIKGMRIPAERNGLAERKLPCLALRASIGISKLAASIEGLRTNEHFLGFKRAGGYGLPELCEDIPALAPGVTELALHPSQINNQPYPDLRGLDEMKAVCSPEFLQLLEEEKIVSVGWNQV